jgi:hypothetical protein
MGSRLTPEGQLNLRKGDSIPTSNVYLRGGVCPKRRRIVSVSCNRGGSGHPKTIGKGCHCAIDQLDVVCVCVA